MPLLGTRSRRGTTRSRVTLRRFGFEPLEDRTLLSMLTTSPAADQAAEKIPVSGQFTETAVTDPGKQWVSDDGILHIRDQRAEFFVTGDIQSVDAHHVLDLDLNLATGEGTCHGSAAWENAVFGDRTGSFAGHFTCTISPAPPSSGLPFFSEVDIVYQGSGGLAGTKLMIHAERISADTHAWEGIVLDTNRSGPSTPFSEMIVFGASFADTGNVLSSSGGVITPEPYFEGRASNGPVWVERLADQLELPAPEASVAGGSNYAYYGAETGSGFNPLFPPGWVPNMGEQIDTFFTEGHTLDGDELIVVEAPTGNDMFVEFVIPGSGRSPAQSAENIAEHITNLAAAGGETFLVPNGVPAGHWPFLRGGPLETAANDWSIEFRTLLDAELDEIEADLGDAVTILRFDLFGLVEEMLNDPKDFGLKNVTDPACPGCAAGIPDPDAADSVVPNPNKHFYWDTVHPTRAVHQVWGDRAAELVLAALDEVAAGAFSLASLNTYESVTDPDETVDTGLLGEGKENVLLDQSFATETVAAGQSAPSTAHEVMQLSAEDVDQVVFKLNPEFGDGLLLEPELVNAVQV